MTDVIKFREIVIVDDEEQARADIRIALDGVADRFMECDSGLHLMKSLNSQRWDWKPELIFVDLGMPAMSGYDVIRRLREKFTHRLPIIVVTKMGTGNDIMEAQIAGADAFVKKPVTAEKLMQAIMACMQEEATPKTKTTIPYFL